MATIDSTLTAIPTDAQIFTMADGNLVAIYYSLGSTGWGYRIKSGGSWGSRTALTGTPNSQRGMWRQSGDNIFGAVSGSTGVDFITYKLAYASSAITQTNNDTGDNVPVLGVYLDNTRVYVVIELTSAGVYLYAFAQSNITTAPTIAAAQITAGSPPASGNVQSQWAVVGDGGATFYIAWFASASSTFNVASIVAGASAITTQTAETSVPATAAAGLGLDAIWDGTNIVFLVNQNNAALRWARRTAANTYDSWTTLVTEAITGRPNLARKGTGAGSDLMALYARTAGQANGEVYKFCRIGGTWDSTSQSVAGGASTGWASPTSARSDVNQSAGVVPIVYTTGTASTWTLADDSTTIAASGTTNVTSPIMAGVGGMVAPLIAPATISTINSSRSEATDAGGYTTASSKTWTHTPTGRVNGVVLAITQPLGSADEITAASYGGVAMTRSVSQVRTTTEAMRVYLYFLGTGIPQGAQTVSFTSSGTLAKQGHVFTFATTDNSDAVVDASNSSDLGIIANPSITVTHTGSLNAGGWAGFAIHGYGGAATPTLTASSAKQTGETAGFGHDPGAATAETYYRTATATASSSTYGYTTLTSDDQVIAAIVVKPSAGTNQTVTAVIMGGTGDLVAPAVAADSAVTTGPMAGTGDIPAPAVSGTGDATTTAVAMAGTGGMVAPIVTAGATITAPVMAGTGSFPPANQMISSVVTTLPMAGTGDLVAPAVSAASDQTVTTGPMAGIGDLVAPAVSAGAAVTAPVMAGAGDMVAPVVSGGASGDATVVALPMAGVGDLVAPVVTAAGVVATGPMAGIGDLTSPAVSGDVGLVAPVMAATGDLVSPDVTAAATVATVPMAGTGGMLSPGLPATVAPVVMAGRGAMPSPSMVATAVLAAVPMMAIGRMIGPFVFGTEARYFGEGTPAGRIRHVVGGRTLVASGGRLRS